MNRTRHRTQKGHHELPPAPRRARTDGRLLPLCLACLGASLLLTGGTLASPDDVGTVPDNQVRVGVLAIRLDSAPATAPVAFTRLQPGSRTQERVYAVVNDQGSGVPATLTVSVSGLVERAAPCDISPAKASGELASHLVGCTVTRDGISGTPGTGVVSRLLDVSIAYGRAATDPAHCAPGQLRSGSVLPTSGPGNLRAAATAGHDAGTTVALLDTGGSPIVLAPGRAVCVAVSAYWPAGSTDPEHATPDHPVDDAAQGDALSVDLTFRLTQFGRPTELPPVTG